MRLNFVSPLLAIVAGHAFVPANASAEPQTNQISNQFLLKDRLGNITPVPTNEVHSSLHPPATTGFERQIPVPAKGTTQSEMVRERLIKSQTGRQWFPPTPPVLMPYLANLDEYGNSAIQENPLFPIEPLSKEAESGKYRLFDVGLSYSFYQSFTTVSMTDVASGASALQFYTATFLAKWVVTAVTNQGHAGGLSTEANVQLGLSPSSRKQSPQASLRTVVNPTSTVFGPNGIWLSELAWQESLADGKVVILAGMVDQSNYIDANSYANNSQGQFMNSAFVNSLVLPLPVNNLGLNLQFQPDERWYVMFGTGANNQPAGHSPFDNLSFDNWSYLLEFGLTPSNVFGLGPGIYRLQPFVATVDGDTQTGVGLNAQQKLGADSPFGWFGRFGVGGTHATGGGAEAQVATGFVMKAPLNHLGLCHKLNDYLGAAFVWSRPSAALEPVAHKNEYGLEAGYVLQLTPLASLQPDVQVIWNPAGNPDSRQNVVFQLQLNLIW